MKFVVCGNYGAANLGDEMILEGLKIALNQTFPNSEVKVIQHFPLALEVFLKVYFKKTKLKK